MGVRGLTAMLAAWLLSAQACSKSEPAAPAEPPTPAPAPAAAEPVERPPVVPGRVAREHKPGTEHEVPPPPEGKVWAMGTVNRMPGIFRPIKNVVDVCVYRDDELPCVETDNVGFYRIAVPRNAQVALLFRGEGLTPTVRPFVTGDEIVMLGNSRVANDKGFDGIAEAIGIENPPNTGGVFFAGVTGTTATLEPASGTRFFLKYGDQIDAEATGVPMRGSGGFLGVAPGMTKIRFKHEDGPCRFLTENLMSGWPDPKDPGVAVVPVLAGHHVHTIAMYCGKDSHAKVPGGAKPRTESPTATQTEPTEPPSATAASKSAATKED